MKSVYDVVIAEEDIKGHHGEWIYNVVDELKNAHAGELKILLLLSERFPNYHEDIFELIEDHDTIDAKYIFKNEKSTKLKQSRKDWKKVKKFIEKHEIRHCVFMGVNKYQYNFFVDRLSKVKCEFFGVYLHPFTEVSVSSDSFWKSVKNALYYFRRMFLFMAMTTNRSLKKIYVLDDSESKNKLKKYSIGDADIEVIPDPLPKDLLSTKTKEANTAEKEELTRFLIFGAIRAQKGVLEALLAIEKLPDEYKTKLQIKIIGKGNKSYEKKIMEIVKNIRNEGKVRKIIREDRFISTKEIKYEFQTSDVVLIPYQRTEGSSGVLGISALTETPVIGPSKGPIGRKIRKYGLGVDVNTKSILDLSSAIKKSIHNSPNISSSGASEYVETHRPVKFVDKLFGAITD